MYVPVSYAAAYTVPFAVATAPITVGLVPFDLNYAAVNYGWIY